MSSLLRYRRPGGFIQLLSLIETFGPAKRAKFLEMIEGESVAWTEALRDKMLTPERLATWPVEALLMVLRQLPPKSQVYALEGFSKEMKAKVWTALPVVEQRRLTEVLSENKPKAEEIASIVTKFVETARRLLVDRDLVVERVDATLRIDSDIEAKLDGEVATSSSNGDVTELRNALKSVRRENAQLRDDVAKLREKLDQIKKFAA